MISHFEHWLKMIRGFVAGNIISLYCLTPNYFHPDWINKKPLVWFLPWMGYYERNNWYKEDDNRNSSKG